MMSAARLQSVLPESILSTSSAPRIYVFTSATSMVWPDLSSIGVSFPAAASYNITIDGLAPFPTMDDALGLHGLSLPFPWS